MGCRLEVCSFYLFRFQRNLSNSQHIRSTFLVVFTVRPISLISAAIENLSSSWRASPGCIVKTWNWAFSNRISDSRSIFLYRFIKYVSPFAFTCSELALSNDNIALLYAGSTFLRSFWFFLRPISSYNDCIFIIHVSWFFELYDWLVIASVVLNIRKRGKFCVRNFCLFRLSVIYCLFLHWQWWCLFGIRSIILIYDGLLFKIVPSIFEARNIWITRWLDWKLIFFRSFYFRLLHDCILFFGTLVGMSGPIGVDWVTIFFLLYFGRMCNFRSSQRSFLSFLSLWLARSMRMHWIVVILSAVVRMFMEVGSDP